MRRWASLLPRFGKLFTHHGLLEHGLPMLLVRLAPFYFGNKLGDSRAHEDYRERRFERSFKERRLIN
jgi:hypothetical protein